MRTHLLASLLVSSVFALACGPDTAPAGGRNACPLKWKVVRDAEVSSQLSVEDGALVLAVPAMPRPAPGAGPAVDVYQDELLGDFDAAFEYEAFVSGGAGAYVQAAVAASTQSYAVARIGTHPVAGVAVALATSPEDVMQSEKATTATSGTLRFQRVGGELTVTSEAGGESAQVTGSLGDGALTIGVQFGSNHADQAVPAPSSIRITRFALTGGGAHVRADGFDCDSLKP